MPPSPPAAGPIPFHALLDRAVPTSLRGDAAAWRQARFTALLTAVLVGAAGAYALFYALVLEFAAGALATGVGALGAALAFVVLRATGRLSLAGHVLPGVLCAVVAWASVGSGGLASPVVPWMSMPPMLAALLLGWRAAAGWAVLCVGLLGALAGAVAQGVAFPVGYAPRWTVAMMLACHAGLVVCGSVVLYLYERIRAEAQAQAQAAGDALAHQAFHDALTGLPNRARLRDRLAAALDAATAAGHPERVAVLLLDLDGFKLVNDTAGHAVGDALLVAVAERLLGATRGSDLVARLGGDEFAVLLTNVGGEEDAVAVAERAVRSLARPFAVHGTSATVGASVGVARGGGREPGPEGKGDVGAALAVAPVDAVLRDADLALYVAKARGRGRAVVYAPAMHAAAIERVTLEEALRRGLARGEFRLAYQPIVDLATGALIGAEALVRWWHPERGLVAPADFVPLAEETGLIVPLGRWVLEEACRQAATWRSAAAAAGGDAPRLTVGVNVSGRQLARPELVDEVRAALAGSGLPADRLVLELTESTVIQHPEAARERLAALKALGVRLAIDDFGTGYSALSYLRQFPIDVLKIDKSFVGDVAEGGQPAALAAAIVALGDALSLRTVAEGVESAAQATVLAELGCPLAQGYHFGRPVDAATIAALLAGARAPAAGAEGEVCCAVA